MEYNQLIRDRYSVRKFSDKKVEKEKLDALMEAGQIAPTAGNKQPQRILVLQSDEAIRKINECSPCIYGAQLVMIVCYQVQDYGNSSSGVEFAMVDASIVQTHIMLEATDLGLGSVWVGMFEAGLVREKFNIPENYKVVGLLPIGYAADDSEPYNFHNQRFPLGHTYTAETY